VNYLLNKYVKLNILILIFCIGFPYTIFILSSNLSQTWTYEVDSYITSIDISENDEYIVAGTNGGYVYLFHKDESKPIQIYKVSPEISKVAISADGNFIVVGTYSKIFLFNRTSPKKLRDYTITYNAGSIFSFSKDGNYILTGSTYYDWDINTADKLYLFHTANSTPLWELPIPVQYTAITSNGVYFIISGSDGLSLFSLLDSTPLWTFSCSPVSISISINGDLIVIGNNNGDLYRLNKQHSSPLWTFASNSPPFHIGISTDGNYIFSESGKKVYLFNKESSIPLQIYELRGNINSADISLNGYYLAVAMSLPLWDKSTSLVYVYSKYQYLPIWTKDFDASVEKLKISNKENYIVLTEYGESYNMIYKINFLSPFPYLDYVEGLIYVLFFSALPCSIMINLSFLIGFIIKSRHHIKQILREEEKEIRDFNDKLSKTFEKWDKQEDKKFEE
jgi:outer membrane protein assembly factor BamB